MSSPAHDALDRLDLFFARTPHGGPQEWLATVRERLDTLTTERDKLQGRVYALENVFPEDVRAELDTLTAQVERLSADLDAARTGEMQWKAANTEAYDRAIAAEAQVEQLTQERDAQDWFSEWYEPMKRRAFAAEAEVARLRALIAGSATDEAILQASEAEVARLTALLETTREEGRELRALILDCGNVMEQVGQWLQSPEIPTDEVLAAIGQLGERTLALLAASSPPPGDTERGQALSFTDDPTTGLPDDLARVLRDPSIVVPQDAGVWALIGEARLPDGRSLWDAVREWQNAPSNTASASPSDGGGPK